MQPRGSRHWLPPSPVVPVDINLLPLALGPLLLALGPLLLFVTPSLQLAPPVTRKRPREQTTAASTRCGLAASRSADIAPQTLSFKYHQHQIRSLLVRQELLSLS